MHRFIKLWLQYASTTPTVVETTTSQVDALSVVSFKQTTFIQNSLVEATTTLGILSKIPVLNTVEAITYAPTVTIIAGTSEAEIASDVTLTTCVDFIDVSDIESSIDFSYTKYVAKSIAETEATSTLVYTVYAPKSIAEASVEIHTKHKIHPTTSIEAVSTALRKCFVTCDCAMDAVTDVLLMLTQSVIVVSGPTTDLDAAHHVAVIILNYALQTGDQSFLTLNTGDNNTYPLQSGDSITYSLKVGE